MLFIPNLMLLIGSKKTVEEPQPVPTKMGDYFKFFYCHDCGHAVHDRAIKNIECCSQCGSEGIKKTVGRWLYEWKVNPYFSCYSPVKFFPKGEDETTKGFV